MGLHLSKATSKDGIPVEIRCALQDLTAEAVEDSPDLVHCSAHGIPKFIKISDLEAQKVILVLIMQGILYFNSAVLVEVQIACYLNVEWSGVLLTLDPVSRYWSAVLQNI